MLQDLFKSEYTEIKEYSLQDKIRILGLSQERINELGQEEVKDFLYDSDAHYQNTLEVIEVDKIVGIARAIWDYDWLSILEKYCHKGRNFERYNADNFDSILMCEQVDGYPSVVEKEDGYYISGNGLHRLTIAKCLGNKKAMAVVQRIIE